MLAITLILASTHLHAQLDNCQNACPNGSISSLTKTINFPSFGVIGGDKITYTFYYNICNGIMYMVNMKWTATYNGVPTAYTVNGYDRTNDILGIVWANFPAVHTVGFPASCFKMEPATEVLYEGIVTRTDYTTIQFCDPGCCLFKRGEFAGDALEIQDPSSVATCNTNCFPYCRGNRP